MVTSRAVYTALIGRYEELLEQPVATDSHIEFICFTDDPNLASQTWRIVLVEPLFPGDPVRSSRALKIRGNPEIDTFAETLWIDNTVLLTADPNDILDEWLSEADLAIPTHSFREKVDDEFAVVTSSALDDPARILEQRTHYARYSPGALDAPVLWTGIIARRQSPEVSLTMQLWLDHVLRYSRRDQLSVGVALRSANHPVTTIDADNLRSQWHEWPRAGGRVRTSRTTAADTRESLTDHVLRLLIALEEQTIQFSHAVDFREAHIAALLGSRSWRAGAPLRATALAGRWLLRRLRRSTRRAVEAS